MSLSLSKDDSDELDLLDEIEFCLDLESCELRFGDEIELLIRKPKAGASSCSVTGTTMLERTRLRASRAAANLAFAARCSAILSLLRLVSAARNATRTFLSDDSAEEQDEIGELGSVTWKMDGEVEVEVEELVVAERVGIEAGGVISPAAARSSFSSSSLMSLSQTMAKWSSSTVLGWSEALFAATTVSAGELDSLSELESSAARSKRAELK